ncbi:MAG: hypothetical protein FD166_881 [Bacteroidetes bacterium]|nr:MAG: hypothetical protein FD166_881 [Bacteroidota bacterium]
MKKSVIILFFLSIFALPAMNQTEKAFRLLNKGIESDDIKIIDKALANEISPDQGLNEAVKQNKLEWAKYFVAKGADPSQILPLAVLNNNVQIVDYLLKSGCKFYNIKADMIDGQVYLVKKNSFNDTIPVFYSEELNRKVWSTTNSDTLSIDDKSDKHENLFFKYKTKEIYTGNQSLLFAIRNRNIEMIKLLLNYGFSSTDISLNRPMYGLTYYSSLMKAMQLGYTFYDNNIDGYIVTDAFPVPALLGTPVEYCILNNVDFNIFRLIKDSNNSKVVEYSIGKVDLIHDDSKITDVRVETNEYGFRLQFKQNYENGFGYRISYSIDNRIYKELKHITVPYDSILSFKDKKHDITQYYHNFLKGNLSYKDLKIKIEIIEYGLFTDPRDNQVYRTLKIGKHTIMAENLRFKAPEGCWAYDNNERNIVKFGYLYDWEAANKSCPVGWHIPSPTEWCEIFGNIGQNLYTIQNSGFNLVFGGYRNNGGGGNFNSINVDANYLSSTVKTICLISVDGKDMLNLERNYITHGNKSLGCSHLFYDQYISKKWAMSLRLIKDK